MVKLTILEPSARRMTITPEAPREYAGMSAADMRMTVPLSVIIKISSSSVTVEMPAS